MSKERLSPPAEPPSDVQVTVIWQRERRTLGKLTGHVHVNRAARAAMMLVLIGALIAAALSRSEGGAARHAPVQARSAGPVGVATAYGYPLRCLSVTISARDRTYARADFDHRSVCGRYDGTVTALVHRVGGAWRVVLDAVSYRCPVASVPSAVQTELGVCT